MNLNKTLGRVATTLVAATMLASLTAVPAFAETSNAGGVITNGDNAITEIVFNKTLKMPVEVPVPDVTFNFTMTGATADSETATDGTNSIAISSVASTTQLTGSADFDTTTSAVTDAGGTTKTATVKATIPLGDLHFNEPGVYKFSLSENALDSTTVKNAADFTLSDAARSVYLYVEGNNSDSKIVGAVIVNGNAYSSSSADKVDAIGNYYMLTGDPDEPDIPPAVKDNKLTIGKTVSGQMGNKSTLFDFDVTITSTTSGKTFTAKYMKNGQIVDNTGEAINDPDHQTFTVTAGSAIQNVKLSDGMTLVINGLSNGDGYTVDEDRANLDNYSTTINNNGTTVEKENSADGVSGSFVDTNMTVQYTNDRAAVSPTGIVMNVAPYVLLVIVAAAGCFVFLRKRRED